MRLRFVTQSVGSPKGGDVPDITAISTAIQSLKTAADMAQGIRKSVTSLEDASINFQIAELTNALADLKLALADVKEENLELREKISKLSASKSFRGQLVLKDNVYYPKDIQIEGYGNGPWCTNCFDSKEKLVVLHHKVSMAIGDFVSYKWECPNCKSAISAPDDV
jgi:hypothetical protein